MTPSEPILKQVIGRIKRGNAVNQIRMIFLPFLFDWNYLKKIG